MDIQQYPLGFLAALNAKSTGYTPRQLEDVVRATLDMLPFYFANIPPDSAADDDVGISAINTGSQVTVPANEAWLVIAANAEVSNPTAPPVRASIKLNLQPADASLAATTLAFAQGSELIGTGLSIANSGIIAPWTPPFPFIVNAGASFQGRLAQTMAAGTVQTHVRVFYRPLSI